MPRKTEFELERINTDTRYELCIVTDDEGKPVVELSAEGIRRAYIKDRDLERFAVNILKALNSKKLK